MDIIDRVIRDGYAIRIEVDRSFCDPVTATISSRRGEPVVLYRVRKQSVEDALEALEELYESDGPLARND